MSHCDVTFDGGGVTGPDVVAVMVTFPFITSVVDKVVVRISVETILPFPGIGFETAEGTMTPELGTGVAASRRGKMLPTVVVI